MISHFSTKPPFSFTSSSSLAALCLRPLLFRPSLHLPPPPPPVNFHSCSSPLSASKSRIHRWSSFVCHFGTSAGDNGGGVRMESSSAEVEFVAHDLKRQSLGTDGDADGGSDDSGNGEESRKVMKLKLEDLNWDHSFVRELPGDPRTDTISRQVLHACYTKVSPSAEVDNPQLVAWSESVAELLDLDSKEFERPDFPVIFSGASLLPGTLPYAQCYGGHQFGMWAGQLGDGRAITLGEVVNSKGERWELQLKGAGKTPYSRFADGLAVLRSSIREFLCSEAMHSLGIPTTRALCVVTTGKEVTRDMFYEYVQIDSSFN